MIQKKTVLFLVSIFVFIHGAHSKVIIWDLGDVLLKQSSFAVAREIGIGRFMSYAFFDKQSPNIQSLLFDVLDTMGLQSSTPDQQVCCAQNIPLPQIMCDWLAGVCEPIDLIARSNSCIDNLYDQNYFVSERERDLVKETISAIFDPERFAYQHRTIPQGLNLLKECARYRDENGNPHTLIVLSNWDPHSFNYLHQVHRTLFNHFDHIVISGDCQEVKPHFSCFQYVINTYQLDPQECYFIDDQLINVEAAERCDIHGLWLKNGNYRELRRKMKSLGLVS